MSQIAIHRYSALHRASRAARAALPRAARLSRALLRRCLSLPCLLARRTCADWEKDQKIMQFNCSLLCRLEGSVRTCWCALCSSECSIVATHSLLSFMGCFSHNLKAGAQFPLGFFYFFFFLFSPTRHRLRRSSSRNDSYRYDKRGGSRRCGACLLAWCGMDTLERLSNFHTCQA